MSDVKAATTEQLRLKNYRDTLQLNHDRQVKDIEDRHQEQLGIVIERNENQEKTLEGAFEVKISQEAAQLSEKLAQIRDDNNLRLEAEKQLGQDEIKKVREQTKARVEQIKAEADERAEKLTAELQAKTKKIYEQEQAEERKAAYRSEMRERMKGKGKELA